VINTWIPYADSDVELNIKNLDIKFTVDLDNNPKTGEIVPNFITLKVDIGDSYLNHDNWFIALLMHQIIFFFKVVFENSVYFMGILLFNEMFTPILAEILNYYELPIHLKSPIPGQDTFASF